MSQTAHVPQFRGVDYRQDLMARKRTRKLRRETAKSRDILDRSHDRDFDSDLDLESSAQSEIVDFGTTAEAGFAEAWNEQVRETGDQNDSVIDQFGSDPETIKSRDLDRRSKRPLIAVLAIAALAAAGFFAFDQGYFERDEDAAEAAEAPIEIAAPDDPREYTTGPTAVQLDLASSTSTQFQSVSGAEPQPVENPLDGLPTSITAGPVLWADRLHIAVAGDGLGERLDEQCVLVSLVRADLVPIDVAGAGECDERVVSATGDRIACSGADLVMIEVWVDDPRTVGVPPPTELVRARIEQRTSLGVVESVRTQFDVPSASPDPVVAAASTAAGAPGDIITVRSPGGGVIGTCELIDRASVQVQLLPS